MKTLLYKELRLAASPLSFFFLAGALLTLAPGYPILIGTFFFTLGIFYSFQAMRENNDLVYTLLLPVAKADVVRAKFAFCVVLELCGFLLTLLVTLLRMTVLSNVPAYTSNALMTANLTFLGFSLFLDGLFNAVFLGGFFKTAYYFGKPFITYAIFAILTVFVAEALHHLPGCALLNAFGFTPLWPQLVVFLLGAASFFLLTLLSLRRSIRRFEQLDL